jgi:hypothetical protein
MTDIDLRAKLTGSQAYKSLVAERDVISACKRLGWKVIHSCYYDDPNENKIRELDVLATQTWTKAKGKKRAISVQLCLLGECKSAIGYHLLFSDEPFRSLLTHGRYAHWLGDPGEMNGKILNFINSLGLDAAQRIRILNRFEEIAYPRDYAITAPFLVDPMPAPFEPSAYRETNTQGERELENSVLWKAVRSVGSAMKSFQDAFWGTCVSDFNSAVQYATLKGHRISEELETAFERRVDTVVLFHPVVFIESHLWKMSGQDVEPVQWCPCGSLDFGILSPSG